MKRRLDILLVERGHFSSRNKARQAVLAGWVTVNKQVATKPGTPVSLQAEILIAKKEEYVSRGGQKLKTALEEFGLEIRGLTILDGGASTGGFTHCLLAHGARRVYAVDVGHDQLASGLRQEERVVSLEGVNLRDLDPTLIPEMVDLVVLDLSFISVGKVLAVVNQLLHAKGLLLILVKPQFEVGPENVNRRGLVRNPALHKKAVTGVWRQAKILGWGFKGLMASPLLGATGNKEFFLLLKRSGRGELTPAIIKHVIDNGGIYLFYG